MSEKATGVRIPLVTRNIPALSHGRRQANLDRLRPRPQFVMMVPLGGDSIDIFSTRKWPDVDF